MSDERLNFVRARMEEALGGRSVETFCAEAGGAFKRNTLRRWLKGETSPNIGDLIDFADATGKTLEFFLPKAGSGTPMDVRVPKLDIRAAAGGGAINGLQNVEETLEFPRWMIDRLVGRKGKLSLLRAHGDSMEPLMRSGALLLVDESDRDYAKAKKPVSPWHHTDIFVFLQGDELRVKRLLVDPKGAIVALSENPSYLPEVLRKQDFKMQGRVVWWDNFL